MNIVHMNSYHIDNKLYKILFEKLDEAGMKQKIYVPVCNKELMGRYDLENVHRAIIKYDLAFNPRDRVLTDVKVYKLFKGLNRNFKILRGEILHAHSLFINGRVAYKMKKDNGNKYIVAVRNTDVNVFFKYFPFGKKIGTNVLKNASKIVFISGTYRDRVIDKYIPHELKKEIAEKSYTIPNGVDDFWIENRAASRKSLSGNDINIAFLGKINKNKNILNLVNKIIALNEKSNGKRFILHIIGSGSLENELIKNVDKYGDFIKYYGYISSKEEIKNIYSKCDLFAMISKTETFGLSYIEAMSQGLPLIYTKGEGIDGYFKDGEVGYSYDVQKDNLDEFKGIIDNIINDYENISKRCLSRIEEFSWNVIIEKYIKMYEELSEDLY